LRFAITSPPSGCEKDFHLQAVEHARHTEGRPLEAAIEDEFGWEALELDRQETVRLTKPLESSAHAGFRGYFPQFRQYTPQFLEVFRFESIPTRSPLLKALDVLRKMNLDEPSVPT